MPFTQVGVLAALAPSSGSYLLWKFLVLVFISVVIITLAVTFWHSEEIRFHFQQRKIHCIKARSGKQSAIFILLSLPPTLFQGVSVVNTSVWMVCDRSECSSKRLPEIQSLCKKKQLSSPVSSTITSKLLTADFAHVILCSSLNFFFFFFFFATRLKQHFVTRVVKGFWAIHGMVQQSKRICLQSTQEAGGAF